MIWCNISETCCCFKTSVPHWKKKLWLSSQKKGWLVGSCANALQKMRLRVFTSDPRSKIELEFWFVCSGTVPVSEWNEMNTHFFLIFLASRYGKWAVLKGMNDDKRVAAAKEAIVPFLCLNSVAQKKLSSNHKGHFCAFESMQAWAKRLWTSKKCVHRGSPNHRTLSA